MQTSSVSAFEKEIIGNFLLDLRASFSFAGTAQNFGIVQCAELGFAIN